MNKIIEIIPDNVPQWVTDAINNGTFFKEAIAKTKVKFQFSNVVVVDDDQIGVIVKSWANGTHDVYVRSYNTIRSYHESKIKHFVYSKELAEDELTFYQK